MRIVFLFADALACIRANSPGAYQPLLDINGEL
jgi:hypothetical protein